MHEESIRVDEEYRNLPYVTTMRLVSLNELTVLQPFDCGDSDLNEFLTQDARFYEEQLLANTYILEDENEIVGYYSLLNDKISQTSLPKNLWRKLRKKIPHDKHLGSYPAVKIGRFAISKNYRGIGIGTNLINGLMHMLVNKKGLSACRFLTVDAYRDAIPFYEKNDFIKMINEEEITEELPTIPMYYDLKQIQ